MRRKSQLVAMMLVLSVLCAYIGYTFGAPTYWGPCKSDTKNTCAITCQQQQGDGYMSFDCTDTTTQVPYCGNSNSNLCKVDQFTPCQYRYYTDAKCANYNKTAPNQNPSCKVGGS
jgi:hypothetical protein